MVEPDKNYRILLDAQVTLYDLPMLTRWLLDHLGEASGLLYVDQWTDPTDPDDTTPQDVILSELGEAAYPLDSSAHMLDVLLQVVLRDIPGIDLYELSSYDVTSTSPAVDQSPSASTSE
jgi:hypothetical protein